MTKRYYYTDPIKAFYMVREFGVIIANNTVLEEQVVKAGKWEKLSRTTYPVAKESEHIFEPKQDDRDIYGNMWTSSFTKGRLALMSLNGMHSKEIDKINPIAARDNKQFLMPEVENE